MTQMTPPSPLLLDHLPTSRRTFVPKAGQASCSIAMGSEASSRTITSFRHRLGGQVMYTSVLICFQGSPIGQDRSTCSGSFKGASAARIQRMGALVRVSQHLAGEPVYTSFGAQLSYSLEDTTKSRNNFPAGRAQTSCAADFGSVLAAFVLRL